MDNHMLVSVIIPTYKRSVSYLSRAVESVRKQTYENIEIIVIDDSTADYPERANVAGYIASLNDKRIRYYQNEKNLGGSLSRNRGIELANGQYITFLDDDDEYMPNKVKKQLSFMLAWNYDLTFSEMRIYSSSGKVIDYRAYRDISSFDNETLLKYHLMKHLTGTPTFMFKSESLRKIGGFSDAIMGQEFYLMLKAIQNNLQIGYLTECDVKVYHHEGEAISMGRNKIKGEKILYNFKKSFFSHLSASERRYIRFRHYAVMAVAYKRNHMFLKMIGAGFATIFSAPIIFIKEIIKFIKKVSNATNTARGDL